MHVAAVIVAAGSGTRFGGDGPKQFIELGGKPVFLWSVDVFRHHPHIEQVVVSAPPDMVQELQASLAVAHCEAGATCLVVGGGTTRQESVFNGLSALAQSNPPPTHVMVHDAARPFVTREILDRVLEQLEKTDACTVAIPASDTVKRVVDGSIVETLKREELHLMQTPQAARFELLYRAHQDARAQQVNTTDDAAILEAAGIPVPVVLGSRFNIKITEKEDLLLSQAIATIIGGSHL